MAATGAKIGKKTQFLRETTVGGGVYAAVAEVKSINGLSMSRDPVDASNMDSPDDHGEFIPGLADGGELSLVLNFRPEHTSQGASAGLLYDFQNAVTRSWQVQWPQYNSGSPPTMTLSGFLTGFEITSATRDLVTVAVKVKSTGKPAFTNFA